MKNKKSFFSAILVMLFTISIVALGSYAFYRVTIVKPNGEANASLVAKHLSINFTDGPTVTAEGLLPGATIIKTFNIVNNGNKEVGYSIGLIDYINEGVPLDYTLVRTEDNYILTGSLTSDITSANIGNDLIIAPEETHNYTLTIVYPNRNYDQSDEMGRTVTGTINIYDSNAKQIAWTDSDNDGTKSIGDVVRIGTEYFNIIENDGTDIKMLARYNLEPATYVSPLIYKDGEYFEGPTSVLTDDYIVYIKQYSSNRNKDGYNTWVPEISNGDLILGTIGIISDDYCIGSCQVDAGYFERENNYQNNAFINIKNTFNEYIVSKLNHDASNDPDGKSYGYKQTLKKYYNIDAEVELITYQQLVALGCDPETKSCNTETVRNNNRQWIYNTSYWTESANWYHNGEGAFGVIRVLADGSFGYIGDERYLVLPPEEFQGTISFGVTESDKPLGLRPVVTISASVLD